MRRAMFLGLSAAVLAWCGVAVGAGAPPAKPRAPSQDPLDAAVEKALQFPAGVQLTAAQETGLQGLREHYRPLLHDAMAKQAAARNIKQKKLAAAELNELKQQMAADGAALFNVGQPATSSGAAGGVDASTLDPYSPLLGYWYANPLGIRVFIKYPLDKNGRPITPRGGTQPPQGPIVRGPVMPPRTVSTGPSGGNNNRQNNNR